MQAIPGASLILPELRFLGLEDENSKKNLEKLLANRVKTRPHDYFEKNLVLRSGNCQRSEGGPQKTTLGGSFVTTACSLLGGQREKLTCRSGPSSNTPFYAICTTRENYFHRNRSADENVWPNGKTAYCTIFCLSLSPSLSSSFFVSLYLSPSLPFSLSLFLSLFLSLLLLFLG